MVSHFCGLEQRKAVAVRRVANNDVTASLSELVSETLHLVHAVQLVVHGHDKRESRAKRGQRCVQVDLAEEIEEKVGGSGAAIDDDEIRLFQRLDYTVEFAAIREVKKSCFGLKSFQRRILIVSVNGDMDDALVFEELDEIDGEETFADTTFAVQN